MYRRRFSFVLLFLSLAATFLSARSEGSTCPSACRCSEEEVQCTNSGSIKEVPDSLPHNDTLRTLSLSRTKVQVNASSFANLRQLRKLELSNNEIDTLEDGVFRDLSSLDTLVLRRNYLKELTENTFAGLEQLRVLDMSYNHFVELNQGWFRHLTKLQVLDLARNMIEVIENRAFAGLVNLRVLNLTRNKLLTVTGQFLAPLVSLSSLVVDDNTIQVIENGAFSSLLALTSLSLTGNRNLTALESGAFVSKTVPFPLETLSLKGTRLDKVPVEILQTLPNLRTLDLSQTGIQSIQAHSFASQSQLVNLTLDSLTRLTAIHADAFAGLHSLENLVISNNMLLTTLSWGVFSNLTRLSLLDLHNNGIETFRSGLADWRHISVVDLSGNPLRCDCHAAWLLTLLDEDSPGNDSNTGVKFPFSGRSRLNHVCEKVGEDGEQKVHRASTAAFTQQMACYMPAELNGRCLTSLSAKDMQCPSSPEPRSKRDNSDQRFKVAIISATLTSVFLVSCCLFLKFRRRVCSVCRRQYRYKTHRNHAYANGSSPINGDIVELETTQLEDFDSDLDTAVKA